MPSRRRWLVLVAPLAVAVALMWGGVEVALDHASEGCFAERPGYLTQRVVSVERHWWAVDCVMDPRNGDAAYTVHRPWESPRAIRDIDGDG